VAGKSAAYWFRALAASVILTMLGPFLAVARVSAGSEYHLELWPEIELLSGVLSQTTWVKGHGPVDGGNEYYRALTAHMSQYHNHAAVKIAQQLIDRGFDFGDPAAFICHLGPLPELAQKHPYAAYLVEAAGGLEALEEFRLTLKDLAAKADFGGFL
jgi:hypothetical protein